MLACPRCDIWKPPDWPRRDEMSPARDRDCRTLDRKLSGASVARARSKQRNRGRFRIGGGQMNHHADRRSPRHVLVASTNSVFSCIFLRIRAV